MFLVAGMLPLGMAMEATGTAQFLANIMLDAQGDYGPTALLAGTYLLAALITQAMSNAAAIVLIVPIAVDTALGLGANHITFTMAVVIGAATSFLSPVGHKANVLVFGPGGYRFFDFARVGALLTVALLIVSMTSCLCSGHYSPKSGSSAPESAASYHLKGSSVALRLILAAPRSALLACTVEALFIPSVALLPGTCPATAKHSS